MGYFDIQVNGYGGVDFNEDNFSAEGLNRACEALRKDEVDGILATIITEQPEQMIGRLKRLVELREQNPLAKQMIAGIHIEGPFINPEPGFRGAHPLDAIGPANRDLTARFLEAAGGLTRIITLAPEQDKGGVVTRFLSDQGIIVSAGHTNASLDELKTCVDAGLSMFTHLGNGCPAQMPRHDNIIQRALSLRKDLCLCFIADNVHVPFFVLQNMLDLIGIDDGKCLITTDAMSAAGLGPGLHRLGRWEVNVGEDLAARSPDGSHLVGSAVSMPKIRQRLKDVLQMSDERIDRLTKHNPRKVLGL